jgi:hypothetical protein
MSDESVHEKQTYLINEIIKKGYDAQEFSEFLSEIKGEEKIDLEFWTMEELKNAVESFTQSKNKNNEKNEIVNSSEKSEIHQNKNNNKNEKNDSRKKPKNIFEDMSDSDDENNNIDINLLIQDIKESKIECVKLTENEITKREDLYIELSLPSKTKSNMFTSSTEFIIETKKLGWKTTRKISDFEFLNQKLNLINPEIFNPFFYINKSNSIDAIMTDATKYLKIYINSLVQNPYFRTLPIVYDFITLSPEEWEKIKVTKYDIIKERNQRSQIPNLEGYFNIKIEKEDIKNYLKIKSELVLKNESFSKFNNYIEDLLKAYDKIGLILKDMSDCFKEVINGYINDPDMTNLLAHLEVIGKIWEESYTSKKIFISDEIKYFFKYMNKENHAFLKYYNNFEKNTDLLKSKYIKVIKIQNPSQKDKNILNDIKKEVAFKLTNISEEYKKLNENQSKRIIKKLNKIHDNKNNIFKDIDTIFELLSFFKNRNNSQNNEKINDNNKLK